MSDINRMVPDPKWDKHHELLKSMVPQANFTLKNGSKRSLLEGEWQKLPPANPNDSTEYSKRGTNIGASLPHVKGEDIHRFVHNRQNFNTFMRDHHHRMERVQRGLDTKNESYSNTPHSKFRKPEAIERFKGVYQRNLRTLA